MFKVLLTGILTAFIAACGGGGGTSSSYTVGGTLNGLQTGKTITLANNDTNNLTLTANGSFTFTGSQSNGSAYRLSIVTPPPTSHALQLTVQAMCLAQTSPLSM